MSQFLAGPRPGTVDPYSLGQLAGATAQGEEAMGNRYLQLGVMQPGGNPQTAAATGTDIQGSNWSTPAAQDLGIVPSLVGGIPGMASATLGQMETNAMSNPTGSGGKTGASILGNIF